MKKTFRMVVAAFCLGVSVLLVVGFTVVSQNFNVTQFLITGTTISVAHLSASLVDSGKLTLFSDANAGLFSLTNLASLGGSNTAKINFSGTGMSYSNNNGTVTWDSGGVAATNTATGATFRSPTNAPTATATNLVATSTAGDTAYFPGVAYTPATLNANTLTGGVWRVDVPGFAMVPADSGSMTFVTNTPSNTATSIQGAGPSRMMWQVTTAGTNVFINFPLPYNYDGGTVTAEIWFTGGTNGVTKTTNVVTCAASTFGSALGTAVSLTNRVDTVGVSTFWTTNSQLGPLTIGGSPAAGRSVTFQFSVNNTAPQFSITNLLYAHHASVWGTASPTQQGSIVMP